MRVNNLKEWRAAVLKRDNFTCQKCGARDHLLAHHKQPISLHPELLLNTSNGITLCPSCHRLTHTQSISLPSSNSPITIVCDNLLSIPQAAHLLHIHRATVYRWIARRKIASFTIGSSTLIPTTEIDRLKGDQHAKEIPETLD